MTDKEISLQVGAFYRELPFNMFGDPHKAASSISDRNLVEIGYPDLHKLLKGTHVKSLLEVGCGLGWFAMTAALHYDLDVVAIDFNPTALKGARQVNSIIGSAVDFREMDLFNLNELERHFSVVVSLGVLHHTAAPARGVELMTACMTPEDSARLYLGLYHRFARRPFLRYFERLKHEGKTEEELFTAYAALQSHVRDKQRLLSWFRDQVLHPYESQHTLREVATWLDGQGLEVESTSVNKFRKIPDRELLFDLEQNLEQESEEALVRENRYIPGFFTVCSKHKVEGRLEG